MLIPHVENGQGEEMLVSNSPGVARYQTTDIYRISSQVQLHPSV